MRDPLGLLHRAIAASPSCRTDSRTHGCQVRPSSWVRWRVECAAAGAPGLLLAGDAAGFIDPMTGDGLRFAIRGAELAALEALRALEHGVDGAHVRLGRARRQEFRAKWRFNRALRVLVGSPAARAAWPGRSRHGSRRRSSRPFCMRGTSRATLNVSAEATGKVECPRFCCSFWRSCRWRSSRDCRAATIGALRARGADEPANDVYPWMQVAYPASFVAMTAEASLRQRSFGNVVILGAVVFAIAKVLKYWAIATLGPRWTFRVLVPPGSTRVTTGPYRFLRHPNYLAVLGEFVGMGLMAEAPVTGVLSLLLFGVLILSRIKIEERALARAGGPDPEPPESRP